MIDIRKNSTQYGEEYSIEVDCYTEEFDIKDRSVFGFQMNFEEIHFTNFKEFTKLNMKVGVS